MDSAGKQLILIGAGGHAMVAAEIIDLDPRLRLLGYLNESEEQSSRPGKYLGKLENIPELQKSHGHPYFFIAIGENSKRRKVATEIQKYNCPFLSLTHPSASISPSAQIGAGTIVISGSIINPGVQIGEHCILNTGSIIDHDCVIGRYSSIAPGVQIGGNVTLGEGCAIGIGTSVVHNIDIGNDTVIGAGSLVTKSIPAGIVAYGVPAKKIRDRKPDDPYL